MDSCGFTFDGVECEARGDHFCEPRAAHVVAFFHELLMHTKGAFFRKPFILTDWQRDDIIRPMFGTVVYSDEFHAYKRRYEIAWIEIARKALAVDTPILTANRGWVAIRDIVVGDRVFGVKGEQVEVTWTSDTFTEQLFEVRSRHERTLVAGADHEWCVSDRSKPRGALRQTDGTRLKGDYRDLVLTTERMAENLRTSSGAFRYVLPQRQPIDLGAVDLPVDPYTLGAWLGDGTAKSGAMTAHEDDQAFMRSQFEAAGYETRSTANTQVFYVQKLMTDLRSLGVLRNKHIPEQYVLAGFDQRLALLQGLIDTDGWISRKGKSANVGFCSKDRQLAEDVQFLARSLGWEPSVTVKPHVRLGGKTYGPFFEVRWTLGANDVYPARLPRKASVVPTTDYRSQRESIVSVTPRGVGETRCIGVDGDIFLAGRDLMPTGNCGKSELLAGIMLYLLAADGEQAAELYGIAKSRDQASLVFDVAAQMVQLNPVLARRLRVIPSKKRIVNERTNSFYRVIAADAGAALGSNPHGVGADEILAWHNGEMWHALRTGMGSGARRQPLMVAATTAGNDSEGFAGQMHRAMESVINDPDSDANRHVFVYMRNTPKDADPWEEKNWFHANPALGDFLSLEALRKQAAEAKRNPVLENAFRQFRLNQWTTQSVRWMPMHDFDEGTGTVFDTATEARDAFTGRDCWFGLDLAARQDLCAWCLLFPNDDGSADLLWRFWMPESGFDRLNQMHDHRLTEWVRKGWLTVTEGDVLDFERFYDDIAADALRFNILGGDMDKFASDPVVQELSRRTNLDEDEFYAYNNNYSAMSNGMHETLNLVKQRAYRWHGNPVARFCYESCEAKVSSEDPDLVRPAKVNRHRSMVRIDAVSAGVMALNAWVSRRGDGPSYYETNDLLIL